MIGCKRAPRSLTDCGALSIVFGRGSGVPALWLTPILCLHTHLSVKESKDLICFIEANGRLTCLQLTDNADAYPSLHTEIQLSKGSG